MRYLKLGNTGLDVSPIALGCMTYGDPGRGHPVWSLDEAASRPLIKQAIEAGINFFDTANMYSQGSSEEILGRALAEFARGRGVTPAQVALAWLRRNPVVVAPIVGAGKPSHITDAVASLELALTADEVTALEAPYRPRHDFQGVSDPAVLARLAAQLGVQPAGPR
jgi:aryl-alcohol dehydrogenase-like predicted oxidoreductase